MRVLSIPEFPSFGEKHPAIHPEVAGNMHVVVRRMHEDLRSQFRTEIRRRESVFLNLRGDSGIISRIAEYRHRMVIFCGASKQGRATDVDLFDDLGIGFTLVTCRFLKRIQIHDHQIDRLNAEFFRLRYVLRDVSTEENTAHHLGMHRLHTTPKALGELRDFFNRNGLDVGFLKLFQCSTCGENLIPCIDENLRKINEPRLVRH